MADGPFQPFTADPSSAGTESAVGRMGGEPTCRAAASRPLQSRLADVHARHNETPTVIGASGGKLTFAATATNGSSVQ